MWSPGTRLTPGRPIAIEVVIGPASGIRPGTTLGRASNSLTVPLDVPGEQGVRVDDPGRDRPGHPGQVHKMPGVDVLRCDGAAPGPAAEAEREGQPVAGAARALVEVLVHQHPRGAGSVRERGHGVLRSGMDAAGVAEPL